MNGLSIENQVINYAKRHNMGVGSIPLKDGSCIKVLGNLQKDITEFIHIKDGKCLGAKGYSGTKSIPDAAGFISSLEKHAKNPQDIRTAWDKSVDVIV